MMTPEEIYNGFTDLLSSGDYLVCGFPGQHTIISCSPVYFRGEIEFKEWLVFATPSVLLAMVHTVMRDEWSWMRDIPGRKDSFKVVLPKQVLPPSGDGQIHLVPKRSFEQHTSLIFVSGESVRPSVSLSLNGPETLKFLRRKYVRFVTK